MQKIKSKAGYIVYKLESTSLDSIVYCETCNQQLEDDLYLVPIKEQYFCPKCFKKFESEFDEEEYLKLKALIAEEIDPKLRDTRSEDRIVERYDITFGLLFLDLRPDFDDEDL